MKTTWQKTIVFNLINKVRKLNYKKMGIYKQEVVFLQLITSQDKMSCHYLQIINHTIILLK